MQSVGCRCDVSRIDCSVILSVLSQHVVRENGLAVHADTHTHLWSQTMPRHIDSDDGEVEEPGPAKHVGVRVVQVGISLPLASAPDTVACTKASLDRLAS